MSYRGPIVVAFELNRFPCQEKKIGKLCDFKAEGDHVTQKAKNIQDRK